MAEHVWTSTSSTDVTTAGNYQGNAAPTGTNGSTMILNDVGTASITSGFTSFSNVAAITFKAYSNYQGSVGVQASGTSAASFLTFGTSAANVAYIGISDGNPGNGATLMLLAGDGTNTANIYKSGSKSGAYPVCRFKGNWTLNCYGGEAGFCVGAVETGTLSNPLLKKLDNDGTGDPVLRIGPVAIISGTPRVEAGTLYTRATNTIALTVLSGQTAKGVCEPDALHTFTNLELTEGAKFILAGAITVTTATVGANCVLDGRDNRTTKTLGVIRAFNGASVLLDNGDKNSWVAGAGTTAGAITIICPDGPGTVTISAPPGLQLTII